MSYSNVSKVWTPDSFGEYLKTIKPPSWAKAVCLHHTASPSLAQRPKGWTIQNIINMREFYKGMGWRSGPHLFTDEDQIFGMTPLTETGVHAVSFNRSAIGIEALGNYSKNGENPFSGRGLQVWQTTSWVTANLLKWLNLPVNDKTVFFHRDDPRTSKDCPGAQVSKDWILKMVQQDYSMSNLIDSLKVDMSSKIVANEKNFQPVAKILAEKGYSSAEIRKNLRRSGKDFFWLDDHLEFAYYDTKLGATMAPASELENIKNK
jgi:N-acetylmuramoyl-L-alanine amidase CwlA